MSVGKTSGEAVITEAIAGKTATLTLGAVTTAYAADAQTAYSASRRPAPCAGIRTRQTI